MSIIIAYSCRKRSVCCGGARVATWRYNQRGIATNFLHLHNTWCFINLVSVASLLALVNLGEQRGEHLLRQQGLAADGGAQLVIAHLHMVQALSIPVKLRVVVTLNGTIIYSY